MQQEQDAWKAKCREILVDLAKPRFRIVIPHSEIYSDESETSVLKMCRTLSKDGTFIILEELYWNDGSFDYGQRCLFSNGRMSNFRDPFNSFNGNAIPYDVQHAYSLRSHYGDTIL